MYIIGKRQIRFVRQLTTRLASMRKAKPGGGSKPAVGKNFSFCKSQSFTRPIQTNYINRDIHLANTLFD